MSISISEHSITEFVRWADYLGTFAFAISGTRLAAAHRFDWFGAFVIGLVTAGRYYPRCYARPPRLLDDRALLYTHCHPSAVCYHSAPPLARADQ